MSSLVSAVRRLPNQMRVLGDSLYHLFKNYSDLGHNSQKLWRAWRDGGTYRLKYTLLSLRPPASPTSNWQHYQQRLSSELLPALQAKVLALDHPTPTIAVVVPTYNTNANMLQAMLDSVLGQIYPYWQLCIADDASTHPHVRKILERYAAQDPRIRLHLGTTNHGVSHTSNQALALVDAPFTVLLDHDDLLEPQALYRVAESVLAEDPDMLYSDEVLLDERMHTVLQYLHRPTFSPEYLRSHPYIVHMVGFRTALLRQLNGFNEQLDISQDYDLILRASEQSNTIVHIPEILYQWRAHSGSAGHSKMAQVMDTSTSILQKHLDRLQLDAKAAPDTSSFNYFHTHYRIPDNQRVAIIIPTKNHGALVRQCINSIRTTVQTVAYDIVLIDHASTDPESIAYFETLKSSDNTIVLRYEGSFNFSSINNWAVQQLEQLKQHSYSHYLFCNNDIEATHPGWLEHMLAQCQPVDVGIVGAQLLYPDRVSIQHAGVCVGLHGAAEHYGKFHQISDDAVQRTMYMGRLITTHEVSAVTAACLLMRKETFDAITGYDDQLAVGFGDVDLCLRTLEQGWRILYCPQASLIHHESYSRGKAQGYDPHPEDSAFFTTRWRNWLNAGDPYFNPAYSINHTDWVVKDPIPCQTNLQRRIWQRRTPERQHLEHSSNI